jgi:hypothetical protein
VSDAFSGDSLAIGSYTDATGLRSIAIGSGEILGKGAEANGGYGIAIGYNTFVGSTNGIALGPEAITSVANQMVIGSSSASTTITSIIPGTDQTCELGIVGNGWNGVQIDHLATGAGDHAMEIDHFASSNPDSKAIDIVYDTGALEANENQEPILVQVVGTDATGGEVTALEVLSVDTAANVTALGVGVGVDVLFHEVGAFADPTQISIETSGDGGVVVASSALASNPLFTVNSDKLWIRDAAKFEEIEFILGTNSSNDCKLTFEFSITGPAWATFNPIDGTNGMRNSGVIAWSAADTPSWVTHSGNYQIRITRTRSGSISTLPIAINNGIKVAAVAEYGWDKDAKVTCASLDAPTLILEPSTQSGTTEGTIIYNSATNKLNFYNGSGWEVVTSV